MQGEGRFPVERTVGGQEQDAAPFDEVSQSAGNLCQAVRIAEDDEDAVPGVVEFAEGAERLEAVLENVLAGVEEDAAKDLRAVQKGRGGRLLLGLGGGDGDQEQQRGRWWEEGTRRQPGASQLRAAPCQGREVAARGRQLVGRQRLVRRRVAGLFVQVGQAPCRRGAVFAAPAQPGGHVEMVQGAGRAAETKISQMLERPDQVLRRGTPGTEERATAPPARVTWTVCGRPPVVRARHRPSRRRRRSA